MASTRVPPLGESVQQQGVWGLEHWDTKGGDPLGPLNTMQVPWPHEGVQGCTQGEDM